MIISIKGENFTGKTGFGMGCPTGHSWHETDVGGFDRAIPRHQGILPTLSYYSYPLPQQYQRSALGLDLSPKLEGLKELWYEFVNDYLKALDDPNIHTIVIDTFSQLYSICCDGFLQEKQEYQEKNGVLPSGDKYREQLIQIEYRPINNRMHALLDETVRVDKANRDKGMDGKLLVLIHHMDDVWDKMQVGGQIKETVVGRDAKGWKKCGWGASDLVDYVLFMEQGDNKTPYGSARRDPNKFYTTIQKGGVARELKGMVFEDLTYEELMARVEMLRG